MSRPCTACGHPNGEDLKFCTVCGVALTVTCPTCARAGTPGERFCGHCGASLTPAATSARPSSVEAVPVSGEKKQITVLFADVAGSMDLQEQLDAEVWAQIMGRFVSILAEGVRKFGGTVDKFTGDGIMALFGAPVAQEDHARRACHAAWHLTKAISEYSEELRRDQGVELHVRLGLNSGEVVVGRVGDDVTIDPTALGHTVGLAQRMEAMAEPGTAYLTKHTARLVEGWFRLDNLGPSTVKGVREPLPVYALEGPFPSPPVLHGAGLGIAPLVGRERELALLQDALAMAEEGHSQVVGVVGEAGVGKSRLCQEFAAWAATRGITVRRTMGVSHGREVPLLPILALLRDNFGVTQADSPEEARKKIAGHVLHLDPELDEALPLLFDFLEVPDPDRPPPRLAPDLRMPRVLETLRRVTERRSEQEVLVLVFEDLHWFDPHSQAFLQRLLESFPGSRTLVVANFRPEFSASWIRQSRYRHLPLPPLRHEAIGELLGRLLGTDPSLSPLVTFVEERTGGNPFFVEEVVRSLVEDDTLAGGPGNYRLTQPLHEVTVPVTVQAVLAERIDRLPPEHKAVLQTAAVIGPEFSPWVLADVTGAAGEKLDRCLSALCAGELLQQTAHHYRFWHPLTQEVAYRSLLRPKRAALHAAVARAVVAIEPDRLDERAALLAAHYEAAADPFEAARWNDRAGDFAIRSDLGEAMRRWRSTLTHLTSAPETDDALRLGARARHRLIRYGARTGIEPGEAQRLYTDARRIAERLGDLTQLALITAAYAASTLWRGAVRDGLDLWLEAARLAEQGGDAGTAAACWTACAFPLAWTGPVADGLRAVEKILAHCADDADVGAGVLGYSPLSLSGIARAHLLCLLSGRSDDARAALEESLAMTRSRSETEWVAWGLSMYARLARRPNEFEASLQHAHEAVRLTEDTGNAGVGVVALGAVGIAEVGLRHFPEAAAALQQGLANGRQHEAGLFEEARLLTYLARALLGQGDHPGARRTANQAVDVARRQGAPVIESLALLTRARVQRATGAPPADSDADLGAALTLARRTGATAYVSEAEAEQA
jgi:class 3 adenylate cyclase/tetratricopeptide (TPR) repeat protein